MTTREHVIEAIVRRRSAVLRLRDEAEVDVERRRSQLLLRAVALRQAGALGTVWVDADELRYREGLVGDRRRISWDTLTALVEDAEMARRPVGSETRAARCEAMA